MDKKTAFVLKFKDLTINDVPLAGGKNASLGEMYRELGKKGVRVPNGFAVTAYAYRHFIEKAGIKDKIKKILKGLNTRDTRNLMAKGKKVREAILSAKIPEDVVIEIKRSYKILCAEYGKNCDVAVRSSATAEDLPDASFAGQQETYLNITGERELLTACKKCFASLFTNRAISYREDKGFDHFNIALSIGVQKMVRSDLASSGVMFSIDTESGFKDAVFITGAYGLGENVVQGAVNPDEYYVHKPTLKKGFKPILQKKVGSKKIKMVYSTKGNSPVKNIAVSLEDQKDFVISDKEILKLAKWSCIIEDHYSKKAGKFKPMDMEWAKDGRTGMLYIVQARPETVQSQKDINVLEEYFMGKKGRILVEGASVGMKIGVGKANVIKDVSGIHGFKKGEILVTDMTDPDWEPIMKIASAIVTNRGGRTCFDGNTKILTNNGFMTFKQIEEFGHKNLLTLSFNKNSKKMEWKPIIALMKKQAQRITLSASQSGKITDNALTLTPDHKMINLRGGDIVDTKISNMLENKEMICIAQKIPSLQIATEKDKQLAYLLGGIMTDGSIYRSKTHGEVQFIQKTVPEKQMFIDHMHACMSNVYSKCFTRCEKNISSGFIRGKLVQGQATAYRLYSKQIAYEMHEETQKITTTLLQGSEELAHNFLAGVIDGDGSFHNNRIQIYINKINLLEAVVVACLKLGIVPQVTKNRNIHNVQIVEKLNEILGFTKRVKGNVRERIIKTRFFSAKQILGNNVSGQLKLRRDKNLYVSEENLKELGDPKINMLLESDFRMQRIINLNEPSYGDVYNVTVEDNHTYVVFTEKLTPILVNNCHAAIISRELGIPCVVGTNNATQKIKSGKKITVSCAEGEKGRVYEGLLKFKVKKHNLKSIPKTKTKIMMNIGNPEAAFEQSFIPNEGVGLAREEFIINSHIRIHPNALINYKKIKDKKLKQQIDELTYGYKNKTQFYVDKLAEGIGMIAAAFYPKDVIVRTSDFKSNEYANLIGGKTYEPKEGNPMIGWRGASRYYRPGYQKAFELECAAFKKVRNVFGLTNVKIMLPFVRTVDEGKKVIEIMKKQGLKKGKNGLQIYVMCEIPANVILADEFSKVFDGFSIGSNDLTQLTLGLDRDSEIVSDIYDERNKAVKDFIKEVIAKAKKNKRKIGICGQAPSDFPDFAQFLVECGIDSISLNPDTVIKTRIKIAETEKKLRRKRK
ncbi:phosphoenolpyruvate synthase [Candidatus Pacearchaeota archaeon]|nr:phosphoenolpyruvate synthase [Candidatus Pacearchaeota archaeon]